MRTKVTIIGLGRVGFKFGLDEMRVRPASHVACYLESKSVDSIALCDSNLDTLTTALCKTDKLEKEIAAYDKYQIMLKEFQPEIVSICSPTPTHAEIACAVASSGSVKAIFLEKPIAQSLQEADAIINACKSNGVRLTVNYTRRWSPLYRDVKSTLLREGLDIETIVGIHPGPLLRTGTHATDLFNWLMIDDPIEAQAIGCGHTNYLGTENLSTEDLNISGVISYGDKEAVLLSGKQKPYVLFEVDIIGSNGRIRVSGNGTKAEYYKVAPSNRYENLNELYEATVQTVYERENPLLRAISEVIERQQFISCTGQEARNALQIALALHYSMTHQRPVKLTDVPLDYKVVSH